MKFKNKHFLTTLFLSIFLLFSCGKGYFISGNAKSEISEMCKLLANKQIEEFSCRMLTTEEFEKNIYPHLKEAKQKHPVPVDEYWMLTTIENPKAINAFYNKVKNAKIFKFEKTGKALKKKKLDDIIVYNDIPVYFTNEFGEEIKFEKFISALVCYDDKCKIWALDLEE